MLTITPLMRFICNELDYVEIHVVYANLDHILLVLDQRYCKVLPSSWYLFFYISSINLKIFNAKNINFN
jgi:hypothetical protein